MQRSATHREKAWAPGRPSGGPRRSRSCGAGEPRYIMPPMPPGGMAGADDFSSGFSATIASVVSRSPATDAALSSAVRTTLVGSMMPALSRSSYSSVAALKPKAPFPFFTLSSTIEPSAPALFAIQRSGSSIAFFTILTPKRSSSGTLSLSSTALARMSATPPPGTMPSSTAARDVGLLAGAVDEGGVVLVDHEALAAPEVLERDVLELHAELFGDHAAAGQDADVFQHRLAAVTEARGLHAHALERAADLVDHQGGQRLALHILGHDEERLARAGHLLEQREQVLHGRDLLLVDQDVDVLVHALHAVRVGDKVGTQISAVELHALDHLELRVEALRLLDRDHALLPHLAHRLGDDLADGRVVVGGDGADLSDLLLLFGGLGERLELLHDRLHRLVDAALERHRVVAGDHHLEALGEDGACEHGGRRRPVARHVGGLGGDLLHHLRPHVFELVFQLDLFRHRDPVLSHGGSAERLVEHHVAAAGPERHRHRIGQDVHAAEDLLARV